MKGLRSTCPFVRPARSEVFHETRTGTKRQRHKHQHQGRTRSLVETEWRQQRHCQKTQSLLSYPAAHPLLHSRPPHTLTIAASPSRKSRFSASRVRRRSDTSISPFLHCGLEGWYRELQGSKMKRCSSDNNEHIFSFAVTPKKPHQKY